MKRGCFVTGTDTGVGKTRTACALLTVFGQQLGCRAAAMKPVASGAIETPDGLRNPDALALQAAANVEVPYPDVNPYLFAPATAPHLAAAAVGAEISTDVISGCFARLAAHADVVVVEGAGGWLTPIGPRQSMADVAGLLGLPVILVVALRLGCINHAVLTAHAILAAGIPFAGWVENRIEPDPDGVLEGYPQALAERISAPRLGALSRSWPDPGGSAGEFDLGRLRQLAHGDDR